MHKRALVPFHELWRSDAVLESSDLAVAPSADGSGRCVLGAMCCIRFYFSSVELRMDRASQVLAQGVPVAVPKSYRALADHGGVPRSTLFYRARGRRSIEEKAQSQ